jgi:hypothetical protein
MEWLSRSVQMWQSFNQMLLDEDRALRWRRLLDGSPPPSEIKAADHYVLFAYVNIIFAEYQFAGRKLINRARSSRSPTTSSNWSRTAASSFRCCASPGTTTSSST